VERDPKIRYISDEEVIRRTDRILREIKKLLIEIRDALKSTGGID
jgi:hypothetical protein